VWPAVLQVIAQKTRASRRDACLPTSTPNRFVVADGIAVTPGSGVTIATDEVTGVTSVLTGVSQVQYLKVVDATENSTNKWKVEADGAARIVADAVSTATVTSVASSITVVTIAALNTARRAIAIYNNSTADLYLKYGATASTSSFSVRIPPSGYWEMPTRPTYTGVLTGIWSAANGAALVTEM